MGSCGAGVADGNGGRSFLLLLCVERLLALMALPRYILVVEV